MMEEDKEEIPFAWFGDEESDDGEAVEEEVGDDGAEPGDDDHDGDPAEGSEEADEGGEVIFPDDDDDDEEEDDDEESADGDGDSQGEAVEGEEPEGEGKEEVVTLKLKIDGKESEESFTRDELQSLVQKGKAAEKRFAEAHQKEQVVKTWMDALLGYQERVDGMPKPLAALLHIYKVVTQDEEKAEKILKEEVIGPYLDLLIEEGALPEEARENRRLKRRLSEKERREAEILEERRREEERRRQVAHASVVAGWWREALKDVPNPNSEDFKEGANYLASRIEKGETLSESDVSKVVKYILDRRRELSESVLKSLTADEIKAKNPGLYRSLVQGHLGKGSKAGATKNGAMGQRARVSTERAAPTKPRRREGRSEAVPPPRSVEEWAERRRNRSR